MHIMLRDIHQPAVEEISLSAVYDALSDPVRRLVIVRLAEHGELNCSCFLDYGSKTALSYHLARLREAGITRTRVEGKLRHISLRTADLDARFPGLLDAVVASALSEARGLGGNTPSALELPQAASARTARKHAAQAIRSTKVAAAKVAAAKGAAAKGAAAKGVAAKGAADTRTRRAAATRPSGKSRQRSGAR
jgi:DNA-binding transcriptional ArsR family regulator